MMSLNTTKCCTELAFVSQYSSACSHTAGPEAEVWVRIGDSEPGVLLLCNLTGRTLGSFREGTYIKEHEFRPYKLLFTHKLLYYFHFYVYINLSNINLVCVL